jgi:hypothetical protein
MSIDRVPVGSLVRIAPEFVKRICYDMVTGKLRSDIAPDSILTVNRVIDYAGETYPTFRFDDTSREINGLFLELVELPK